MMTAIVETNSNGIAPTSGADAAYPLPPKEMLEAILEMFKTGRVEAERYRTWKEASRAYCPLFQSTAQTLEPYNPDLANHMRSVAKKHGKGGAVAVGAYRAASTYVIAVLTSQIELCSKPQGSPQDPKDSYIAG